MANETSKAMRRRMKEDADGKFPWRKIFKGKGIDVGPGPDPLKMSDCIGFDLDQGNANNLSQYFGANTFNYLHASQCLEHMDDPEHALRQWITVVKPRGHLVISIPDFVAYEGMKWPSQWNAGHVSTWSLIYKGSPCSKHVHIPSFLEKFSDITEVILSRFVDTNYNYLIGTARDQTWLESDGVECFNEFVLKKK